MNDTDEEETTEVPAPSNAEVARWYAQKWATEWALRTALDPRPTELPDGMSEKEQDQ